MNVFTPNTFQIANRRLSEKMLISVIDAIRQDGYAIIENIVNCEDLSQISEQMDKDSAILMKEKRCRGAGRIPGHLQQGPPLHPPYVVEDVVVNPFVIQITKSLLGSQAFNGFYSGNTNCPDSQIQPLHRDGPILWTNMSKPHPTASIVVNISPGDTNEENGSIELWPETHLDTTQELTNIVENLRNDICPPIRGNVKKGGVLIRDVRLWHRGLTNHTNRPRHMIACVYNIKWLARERKLYYQTGCESVFVNPDLDHNAVFVDQKIDYLTNPFAHQ